MTLLCVCMTSPLGEEEEEERRKRRLVHPPTHPPTLGPSSLL